MKMSLRNSMMFVLLLAFLSLGSVASAQDKVTLEWWDYWGTSGTDYEAVTTIINNYQAAHPNITIERTAIPFGDLKAKVIQAAATGTVPDLVFIDNPDHQAMASQGAFADIT